MAGAQAPATAAEDASATGRKRAVESVRRSHAAELPCPVWRGEGAGRLRQAERRPARSRGVTRAAHGSRRAVPGRDAHEPGRPWRVRPDLVGPRRLRARWRGRGLRLDRLRSPWCRRQRARAVLRSPTTSVPTGPNYVPYDSAAASSLARPLQGLRGRPAAQNDAALLVHLTHHRLRSRHGQHPQGAGPAADQLLRLLLRHLPRPGLRHPVPGAGAAHGPRQQRRPAAGSGTRPTSTRTSPSTATSASSSNGSPSTDDVYHLGATEAGRREPLLLASWPPSTPIPAGGVDRARRVGGHRSSSPATATSVWPDIAGAFAELGARRRPGADQGAVRRVQQRRRRQRLRGLPRRAVHRRPLAAELHDLAGRQLAGLRQGAVRHLGQRLVQRALPHLAGTVRATRCASTGQGAERCC